MRYDVPTYLWVKSNIFSWVSSHGKTLLAQRVTFNWCEACIIPCQPAPPQAREGLQCYLYITEAATRNVRETGNQIIGKLLSMPYTRVQLKLDWRPYCINETIKLNVNSWGHFLWPFMRTFAYRSLWGWALMTFKIRIQQKIALETHSSLATQGPESR